MPPLFKEYWLKIHRKSKNVVFGFICEVVYALLRKKKSALICG